LIEAVRERAESDHGKAFEQWTAVSYKSQVVAGTNFKVKVKVADDKDGFSYAHVKVFRPLPGQGELELKELVDPQRLEDELWFIWLSIKIYIYFIFYYEINESRLDIFATKCKF